MSITPVSKLYEAATEALVAETSAASTFAKMIEAGFAAADVKYFKGEIAATEKQIRKEFEIKSMPGPWRSAKSVITQALELKIKLMNDNGNFLGKTALQAKIKEAKTVVKEIDKNEYVARIIRLLSSVPPYIDMDEVRNEVRQFLAA